MFVNCAEKFGFVVCPACASQKLAMEDERLVRCNGCGIGIPVIGSILDCSGGERSNPIVQQWQVHYSAVPRIYSASADWLTLQLWRKYLFDSILADLRGKLVIDIGCGTAARIAEIAPVREYAYAYVGVDSSLGALQMAETNMPGACFVKADLARLNLRPGIADSVLCLGILMYFKDNCEILNRILDTLKQDGVLLLHEQIRRRAWTELFAPFLPVRRENFPNAYAVTLSKIQSQLEKRGTIVRTHLAGSPMRRLVANLLKPTSVKSLRAFWVRCDSLWCATVGRMLPAVGASEVQIVFRKA